MDLDYRILSRIDEAQKALAEDVMWTRDDLRQTLLAQQVEIKRLQAVVWVLTEIVAQSAGISPGDLAARVEKSMAEVSR